DGTDRPTLGVTIASREAGNLTATFPAIQVEGDDLANVSEGGRARVFNVVGFVDNDGVGTPGQDRVEESGLATKGFIVHRDDTLIKLEHPLLTVTADLRVGDVIKLDESTVFGEFPDLVGEL